MLLVGALSWAGSALRGRGLVAAGEPAPGFDLVSLQGEHVSLDALRGRKVVLYFFAPWCSVCRQASREVRALRRTTREDRVAVYAIGLSWERPEELHSFAASHDLEIPVLVGDDTTQSAYRVAAFPTFYFVDERGRVRHRLVGLTTRLGLWARTL